MNSVLCIQNPSSISSSKEPQSPLFHDLGMWTPGNPKTKEFSLYGRKLTTNEIFFETASAKN
jgi:hypothetical protein